MSAFIVDEKCIDAVLAGVRLASRDGSGAARRMLEGRTERELGQALWEMNEAAVYQRYPHDKEDWGMGHAGEYQGSLRHVERLAAYKAAVCLSYQCAEGDVPETELYRQLEELIASIAYGLIRRLPGWEAATWG